MAEETIGREMVAAYEVKIEDIERSRREVERLVESVKSLRTAVYMEGATITSVVGVGNADVFITKFDALTGHVQDAATKAMAKAMAQGRRLQSEALRAAETDTGRSGKPTRRKGPGREVDGTLINAVKTDTEVSKTKDTTIIAGWHGWPHKDRQRYYEAQEKGARGPAANSLGEAIPSTRASLKSDLEALKR